MFDDRGIEKVRGVSFEVRAGEIVGIAGVDNNGQTELIDALTGLRHAGSGPRSWSAAASSRMPTPREMTDEAGVGHIPEDRHARGLVLDFSLAENLALHDYRHEPDSQLGWLFPSRLLARAARVCCRSSTCAAAARRRRQRRSRAATSRRSCSRARSTATRAS